MRTATEETGSRLGCHESPIPFKRVTIIALNRETSPLFPDNRANSPSLFALRFNLRPNPTPTRALGWRSKSGSHTQPPHSC